MYVETFKTDVVMLICNIMCLMSHWPIIFSRVSFIDTDNMTQRDQRKIVQITDKYVLKGKFGSEITIEAYFLTNFT